MVLEGVFNSFFLFEFLKVGESILLAKEVLFFVWIVFITGFFKGSLFSVEGASPINYLYSFIEFLCNFIDFYSSLFVEFIADELDLGISEGFAF